MTLDLPQKDSAVFASEEDHIASFSKDGDWKLLDKDDAELNSAISSNSDGYCSYQGAYFDHGDRIKIDGVLHECRVRCRGIGPPGDKTIVCIGSWVKIT